MEDSYKYKHINAEGLENVPCATKNLLSEPKSSWPCADNWLDSNFTFCKKSDLFSCHLKKEKNPELDL